MFTENEETDDSVRIYDFNLLKGSFNELDDIPQDRLDANITEAKKLLSEATQKKGAEKLILQINALKFYANALALKDKCIVDNSCTLAVDSSGSNQELTSDNLSDNYAALFSFICVRHPELELDWTILQKLIAAATNNKAEYQDQKTLELAIAVYTSALKEKLK
jgi:hypothetical protein